MAGSLVSVPSGWRVVRVKGMGFSREPARRATAPEARTHREPTARMSRGSPGRVGRGHSGSSCRRASARAGLHRVESSGSTSGKLVPLPTSTRRRAASWIEKTCPRAVCRAFVPVKGVLARLAPSSACSRIRVGRVPSWERLDELVRLPAVRMERRPLPSDRIRLRLAEEARSLEVGAAGIEAVEPEITLVREGTRRASDRKSLSWHLRRHRRPTL